MNDSIKIVKAAYEVLDDKKGQDIKLLDIRKVTVIADYFMIVHGNNKTHVKSLIDNVEDKLAEQGYYPKQKEGYTTGSWILLDYGSVIIHIFSEEDRLFYDLERIWSDGKAIDVNQLNEEDK